MVIVFDFTTSRFTALCRLAVSRRRLATRGGGGGIGPQAATRSDDVIGNYNFACILTRSIRPNHHRATPSHTQTAVKQVAIMELQRKVSRVRVRSKMRRAWPQHCTESKSHCSAPATPTLPLSSSNPFPSRRRRNPTLRRPPLAGMGLLRRPLEHQRLPFHHFDFELFCYFQMF